MFIINGKILTMENDQVIENGYIEIEGNRIKEVGDMRGLNKRMEQYRAPKRGEGREKQDKKAVGLDEQEFMIQQEIIDAKGALVMPGLIDAHCHVGISEEKWGAVADDCNEMVNPITPYLRAIDGINPMDNAFHDAIMGGITSLMTGPGSSNVVGGQSVFMKTQGRCIDHMLVKSPAAMKIAFGENPKNNYGSSQMMPYTRMAVAAMLREELNKALAYAKQKQEGKLEQTDFRMECWLPVLAKKIPLKAHVHRADDILTAIRIAKEFDLRLTLDHCTEGHLVAEEIAASGFPAIVGPDLTSRSKLEIQNMSFKTAGVLARHGVKVAIMSDHPVSLVRYLPLYAGLTVAQGLKMEEGLKALTINAAEICGVSDKVGSICVGKDADIAIFSDNPMHTFTRTLYTIIDGRIVYRAEESR